MSLSQIIDPVIVCGDAAPLVWPPSCKSFPKRFSHLRGSESCFLASVKRAVGEECADPPIMTDESFRFLGIGQLAAMEDAPSRILTRPRPTHGCGCPARCAVICQKLRCCSGGHNGGVLELSVECRLFSCRGDRTDWSPRETHARYLEARFCGAFCGETGPWIFALGRGELRWCTEQVN